MSIRVKGFAALDDKGILIPFEFERRALRDNDVLVKIDYCGICHSDIHQIRNDWKNTHYPLVPGHEIVGRVEKIGKNVGHFKEGDLVGVGVKVDACMQCINCKKDLEQYCEKGNVSTYNGVDYLSKEITQGGYSSHIVVREEFVFNIPVNLNPASCAPLLCAGITTYSPLKHCKIEKGMKVGVVGLGGLGHMGVKFAHAMGAEVTVFTTSESKREDAYRLGATEVVVTKEGGLEKAQFSQHFILNTVAAPLDLEKYLNCLKTDGTMALIGLPEENHPPFAVKSLIYQRRSLLGSLIGGLKETHEMLEYCSENGITSDIEEIKAGQINEAIKKTVDGKVKYRFVINFKEEFGEKGPN